MPTASDHPSRILAIEPDGDSGLALERQVHAWTNADVTVVRSTAAALSAIADGPPDVVLVSDTTPPSDDVEFLAHLRAHPLGRAVPVLSVPPLVDAAVPPPVVPRRTRWRRGRRLRAAWPAYDQGALAARIRHAVEQASALAAARPTPRPEPPPARVREMTLDELEATSGLGSARPRAHRWRTGEVPWLTRIAGPWGTAGTIVNVSSTGVLVESANALEVGMTMPFVLGSGTRELQVPARVVRSSAVTSGPGPRFRTAAAFDREVTLLAPQPRPWPPASTEPLEEAWPPGVRTIQRWVHEEAGGGSSPERLRMWFELGLQQVLGACDVRLCSSPEPHAGGDAVYMPVPDSASAVIRVVFGPEHPVTRDALVALRAGARLASEILTLGSA